MSSHWFPGPFEIDVDNPGYGEILIGCDRRDEDGWIETLSGPMIGEALRGLTALALDEHATAATVPGFKSITRTEARRLLPAFQSAVIVAAGGERAEQLFPQDPEDPPAEPLCVVCGAGSSYTPTKDTVNPWCDRHGHSPFGAYAGMSWDGTQKLYESRRRWWERSRPLGGPHGGPVGVGTGTSGW